MSVIRVEKHMSMEELSKQYPMMWASMYNITWSTETNLPSCATIFEVGDFEDLDNGYDRISAILSAHTNEKVFICNTCPDNMPDWRKQFNGKV